MLDSETTAKLAKICLHLTNNDKINQQDDRKYFLAFDVAIEELKLLVSEDEADTMFREATEIFIEHPTYERFMVIRAIAEIMAYRHIQ